MLKPKFEDRRVSPRFPLDRLAKMEFRNGAPSRHCYVCDMSNGGLRLYTYGFQVPDEFVLFLGGDGPAVDGTYQVVWRRGQEIGVKLVCDIIDHSPAGAPITGPSTETP